MQVAKSVSVKDIAERAKAYNMPGIVVDGQDVIRVYEVTKNAVERARKGDGPSFIEAKTYRFRGHYEGDPEIYRTKEVVESWKRRDPIALFEQDLLAKKILDSDQVERIQKEVRDEVEEANKFADDSPLPELKTALEGLWV
jgi:pyruvate dehydrogenase E1 component alpha subunit